MERLFQFLYLIITSPFRPVFRIAKKVSVIKSCCHYFVFNESKGK